MEVAAIDLLAREVAEIKSRKDEAEDILKQINGELSVKESQLIDALVSEGKDRWLTPNGLLSIKVSSYWSIKDQEKALEFLKQYAPEQIKIHPVNIRGWANSHRDEDPNWKYEDYGFSPYDKLSLTFRRK